MTNSSDALNCIKNLLQVMCCDGRIAADEKVFLNKAAKSLQVEVADWNALLKEVVRDEQEIYPVVNRQKAAATLKAMAVMAKVDDRVDEKEKELLQAFAKSIGVTKEQWKQLLSELDMAALFEPFRSTLGQLAVLSDDFEKIDAFLKTAGDNNAQVRTLTLAEYLKQPPDAGELVCFHAAENKEKTLQRCTILMRKSANHAACILTRFQGHQVKYLHEIGLTRCMIEPVYANEIIELFK